MSSTEQIIDAKHRVITPKDKFLKASEIVDHWGMNMILFGVAGVGKTTLAASAQDSPYGKDVLFIDVEGGTRSIADRSDITVAQPSSIGDVKEIYDWLVSDKTHTFQTIVIDTLSELQRLGLAEIMRTAKDPEWPGIQDWGRSTEQVTRLVRAFRLLSQEKGWNVIFTTHANEQKDEVTGAVLIRPNLTPSATVQACGVVDVVGYLTMNSEGVRTLLLKPTRTVTAKYRQPLQGPRLPDMIENPSLVEILAHLRGEKKLPEGGE